ncbi:hypothetical protein GOBAR_DD14643 [Gossypium barbadense]|nr:hypothetical protein GOBAR_DD14643 [Gossypium barbadense]
MEYNHEVHEHLFGSLKEVASGNDIHFNALDAFSGWKHEGLPPVEVPSAAQWKFRRGTKTTKSVEGINGRFPSAENEEQASVEPPAGSMTRTLVIMVDIVILCTFIESVGLEGGEVIAEAKVDAFVGFVLTVRSTLMVDMVIVKGMMIGTIIMKAEEKGIKYKSWPSERTK